MDKNNNRGFTVVELVVVLAIGLVLAAIAGSNMASWLPDQRLRSSARDLQSAVQLARLECVRLRADVCLDFAPVNNECLVCVDVNTDGDCDPVADGDRMIKTVRISPSVDFYNTAIGINNNQYIHFNARGIPSENGQLYLKNDHGKYRGVNIGLTGNSRMIRSDDGNIWH